MGTETEKKKLWHDVSFVESAAVTVWTEAMNTATGVRVRDIYVNDDRVHITSSSDFIPGEHWNPDKGEFVAINSPDEKLEIAREALDRVCQSADLSTANENVHDLYKIASKALWETK